MRLLFLAVLAVLAISVSPLAASAQAPSRAARVLSLLSGDAVGVVVARDRVFVADAAVQALSACAGNRCAPVTSAEACAVPRCPGSGMLLSLGAPISDVSDLPTDRDGFNHEMDGLRTDPALASIAWSFGVHPEPVQPAEPLAWITPRRTEQFVWELGAYAIGGVVGSSGIGFLGGEASIGFRYTWDPHSSDDDDFLAMLFGDVLGFDLRVRAFELMPTQGASSWSTTIGLAPAAGYATRNEIFRLPTFYTCLFPEVGVALRDGLAPAAYVGWSLPVTFLVAEHLGLETRASVLVVDDWVPGDDVEAIVSFGLGLVGR